ncbi:hypothetical protein ACP70R_042962 [Stipagrostis hirtigluma subsp. patula]
MVTLGDEALQYFSWILDFWSWILLPFLAGRILADPVLDAAFDAAVAAFFAAVGREIRALLGAPMPIG